MTTATWLPDVLRAAGLQVVEHDGWQGRGRPGAFDPKGVILHHTASSANGGNTPALSTVLNGRPDLPGPLSQLLLARDGTWHVIAAGRCNHAGAGKWRGLTSGNTNFFGVEAENDGLHEPWPKAQLVSYARGVAAILSHLHADVSMACGHKEYALPVGRKTDPSFDMVDMRNAIAAFMHDPQNAHVVAPVAVKPTRSMLRKGDSGPSVVQLQHLLGIAEDGDFGPATESAVKAFQSSKGLVADGKVGPVTWTALGV